MVVIRFRPPTDIDQRATNHANGKQQLRLLKEKPRVLAVDADGNAFAVLVFGGHV